MKAITFTEHGGPEVLRLCERPIPQPGRNEVLIKMSSALVSRPDKLMRAGEYPWTNDILPFYPGLSGAGTIAEVGEGVTDYTVGQSVYVEHPIACGCYAEYKLAPTKNVTPIPDGTDLTLAAAANSHLIAWGMLNECFPGTQGRNLSLYIKGAAGSLGTAIVQIAPLLGIRVIASASTDEKVDYLRSLGKADTVFRYTGADEKAEVLAATNGRGADIIMDQSVGEAFAAQFDYLAPMGTILIYNHTKGDNTGNLVTAMTDIFGRCPAIRVFSFHYFDDKQDLLLQRKAEMFSLLHDGKIAPHIGGRFPLEQAVEAHRTLDTAKSFGSLLLDIG